jgi:hypothetical protein
MRPAANGKHRVDARQRVGVELHVEDSDWGESAVQDCMHLQGRARVELGLGLTLGRAVSLRPDARVVPDAHLGGWSLSGKAGPSGCP